MQCSIEITDLLVLLIFIILFANQYSASAFFADFPATHKKFETQGVDIFHFEEDKIKEAWTLSDMSVLAH